MDEGGCVLLDNGCCKKEVSITVAGSLSGDEAALVEERVAEICGFDAMDDDCLDIVSSIAATDTRSGAGPSESNDVEKSGAALGSCCGKDACSLTKTSGRLAQNPPNGEVGLGSSDDASEA